ncbi:hypothetical protein [Pandoraea vervacti]|uniref:hypothetical protein n=1 Tax=Pandoraea vervacti TaxID=656178 RepID=UPI0012F4DCD9|nr:hypothetical protein [Pandoraea vervacti]
MTYRVPLILQIQPIPHAFVVQSYRRRFMAGTIVAARTPCVSDTFPAMSRISRRHRDVIATNNAANNAANNAIDNAIVNAAAKVRMATSPFRYHRIGRTRRPTLSTHSSIDSPAARAQRVAATHDPRRSRPSLRH